MDQKFLTEDGWKAVAAKLKIKDNGLQKALAAYENADEDKYDQRLKYLGSIGQLATTLKRNKPVAEQPEAAEYLADVLTAANAEKAELGKAKAQAAKTAATAQKKADAEAKAKDEEEEGEDQEADYQVKLMSALKKLRSVRGLTFEFICCIAKPWGLVLAKKIMSKHRAELTKLTGSRRFPKIGTCQFDGGKYVFNMDEPPMGMARKLQESIKFHTGKRMPILVGAESEEGDDDEDQPKSAGPAKPAAAPKPPRPELVRAPARWQQMRREVDAKINQLKASSRPAAAGEGEETGNDLEQKAKKIEDILGRFDDKLADSLEKARAAKDEAARDAELKNSKQILADYINAVKSESVFAAVDSNALGVRVNLRQAIAGNLAEIARAIA